jgi:hypothetical protein
VKTHFSGTDTVNGQPFWEIIDDTQTANWQNINDAQTAGWTQVDDTQTANWTAITTI